MKSFRSLLFKMQFLGGCLLCCFLFCLFFFYPILTHQSALCYFSSGEVYYRNITRVLPGGFIIYQYHLLLMQYHHAFFLHFLNRDDCSFSHSTIRCILENNFPVLLLRTLFSEYNHRIISPGYL